jgi:hypothetical protein
MIDGSKRNPKTFQDFVASYQKNNKNTIRQSTARPSTALAKNNNKSAIDQLTASDQISKIYNSNSSKM